MIFLKKDENDKLTGGYKVSLNAVHYFFIIQVIAIVFALLFGISMKIAFFPLILVSIIIAIPTFILDIISGIFGIIKLFRGEKLPIPQMFRAVLVTTQILGWISGLFGTPIIDNKIVFVYLFIVNFVMAFIALVFFVVIEVASDVLLLLHFEKAGFALKSLIEKFSKTKKPEKEEKTEC